MATSISNNMAPGNVINSSRYSIRYICYIEALNKLKPFRVANVECTKQKYQIPHQVPEFRYCEGECEYNYEQFKKYLHIVNEFQLAFEQFKKNY